jgi:hypothetical protein
MHRSLIRNMLVLAVLFTAAHAHAAAVQCLNAVAVKRYVPCYIDLALNNPPAPNQLPGNLYNSSVDVWATFTNTSPSVPPVTVHGFLFSGTTFRFRFNPTTDGTWNYTFFSSNGNIYVTNGAGQTFNAPASTQESGFVRREGSVGNTDRVAFDCAFDGAGACPPESSPVSAPNGVDHPFLWGQTYYQIINNAATKNGATQNLTWQTAITSAKAKGFRKIRMLVYPWNQTYNGSYVVGGVSVPAAQSQPYVATSGCTVDPTQINLTHFNTLDQIVNYMHTNGMVAELILFKDQGAGDCGQTFWSDMDNQRYAKYVFERYAAYPNVIFSFSNEYEGTPYSPAQWNALGEILKPYDPFREHPRTHLLRLWSIHQHERKFPDPGFDIAYTPGESGFMTHASLQWSRFGSGMYPGSSAPPDGWGEELRVQNDALDIPIFDDEFGYLSNYDTTYTTNARLRHRNAIWGLAQAGIYGSVGDTRTSPNITFRSEWVNRVEWDDFQRMVKFFTDAAATVPITAPWWQFRRALYNNAARQAWVTAYSNDYIVVYDAIGQPASSNITFTLPALPAGELWDTWRYDPETGAYAFQATLSDKAGGTSITLPRGNELAHDTVFLLKAQP